GRVPSRHFSAYRFRAHRFRPEAPHFHGSVAMVPSPFRWRRRDTLRYPFLPDRKYERLADGVVGVAHRVVPFKQMFQEGGQIGPEGAGSRRLPAFGTTSAGPSSTRSGVFPSAVKAVWSSDRFRTRKSINSR